MAQDSQLAQVIGRLGRDPESKFDKNGTALTDFSVACNNRDGSTTWYNVAAWGKLGEICNEYLTKGKQVFISGDLNFRTYEKKDGTMGFSHDIRAGSMQMLGSKADSGDTTDTATPTKAPVSRPATRNVPQATNDSDSDLPF